MNDGVYMIRDDNTLVEMRSSPFESEDLLQELLATHPSLIAGDAVDPTNPRRWLLIAREQSVPGEEGGAGRWSLDHLFIDQDGVPTLVEVKRASDTRGRREVVAQMLDYAANGVVYWPIEAIRRQFERTCVASERDPDEALREHLGGPEMDLEEFWRGVDVNLRAGRIRMVFVADVIYPELRRIVEFLNAQMSPAEVIALEIKHYTGQGLRTLVPRLIGRTAEAERRKGSTSSRPPLGPRPSVDEWFSRFEAERGLAEAEIARDVQAWWLERGADIGVTRSQNPSLYVQLNHGGQVGYPAFLKAGGRVTTGLYAMKKLLPFDQDRQRQDVVAAISKATGVKFSDRSFDGEPSVPLEFIRQPEAREKLFTIWQSMIDRIRNST